MPEVPTEELVTAFRLANGYSKKVEKFVDAVKKELIDNKEQTGRFLKEGIPDEKGHLYLSGVEDDELKAEKRVYTKFDSEKAMKLLEKKGLVQLGSEQVVSCDDSKQAYELLEELESQVDLTALVTVRMIKDLFNVTRVATEERVEALVALGQIELDEVKDLMNTSIQYAVKEVKKK